MYQNEKKEKAKKVNIVEFLKKNHPDTILERKDGSFAYSKNPSMTFFVGRDGYYHYCDNAAKKRGDYVYSGDNIKFLTDFVGKYTFLIGRICGCFTESGLRKRTILADLKRQRILYK